MWLIDANSVRDDFVSAVYANCTSDSNNDRANCIIDAFDDLPTIEAEPVKHGEWIAEETLMLLYPNEDDTLVEGKPYFCSVCKWGCNCGTKLNFPYCPSCGAKMDGGEK